MIYLNNVLGFLINFVGWLIMIIKDYKSLVKFAGLQMLHSASIKVLCIFCTSELKIHSEIPKDCRSLLFETLFVYDIYIKKVKFKIIFRYKTMKDLTTF